MSEQVQYLGDGRYRLIGAMGVGGMATVYRAHDTRLDVERAIKVLLPAMCAHKKIRKRFETEAQTMARLHHPNLVTVHDVVSEGDQVFMVMEVLEGGSLMDRVADHGPLTPRQASTVIQATLHALRVAHSKDVVHRDIKPHNILLAADGTPKLTDFGIARVADTDHTMTKTGMAMGTWAYMAPEQRSSARQADHRADLYSTGATLFVLLTNDEPMDLYVDSQHERMFRGVPEPLAGVIKKATQYDREDRYQTASEMLRALQAAHELLPHDPPDTLPLGTAADHDETDEVVFSRTDPSPSQPVATTLPGRVAADETFAFANDGAAAAEGVAADQPTPPRATLAPVATSLAPDSGHTLAPDDGSISTELGGPSVNSELDSPSFIKQVEAARGRPSRAPIVLLTGALFVGVASVGAVAAIWAGKSLLNEPGGDVTVEQTAAVDESPAEAPPVEEGAGDATDNADEGGTPDEQPLAAAPPTATATRSQPSKEDVLGPMLSVRSGGTAADDGGSDEQAAATEAPSGTATESDAETDAQPAVTATTAPVPAADTPGQLFVNSRPWATVTVDGQARGRTWWKGAMPPGAHTVQLRTEDGRTHGDSVTVPAGEEYRYCWDFDTEATCKR